MPESVRVRRRSFLGALAGLGVTVSLQPARAFAAAPGTKPKPLPFRDVPMRSVTAAHLAPHLGGTFRLVVGPKKALTVKLTRLQEYRSKRSVQGAGVGPGMRRPFTLTFQSASAGVLKEGTYTLQHAKMGQFALFLQPVPSADGTTAYLAVFN